MKRILSVVILALLAISNVAIAQGDVIKERQALMKKNGDAAKLASQMIKGEKPYDAAALAEAMNSIGTSIGEFVTLFPEGSTSKDSDAKPEIWKNKADFESWAPEVKSNTAEAAKAAASGVDAFKPAFAKLGESCKGCHEKYRTEK